MSYISVSECCFTSLTNILQAYLIVFAKQTYGLHIGVASPDHLRRAVLQDNHTYERAGITEWLRTSNTSPITDKRLVSKLLRPDPAKKSIIQHYYRSVPGYMSEGQPLRSLSQTRH